MFEETKLIDRDEIKVRIRAARASESRAEGTTKKEVNDRTSQPTKMKRAASRPQEKKTILIGLRG